MSYYEASYSLAVFDRSHGDDFDWGRRTRISLGYMPHERNFYQVEAAPRPILIMRLWEIPHILD